jgi:hypothetical protein
MGLVNINRHPSAKQLNQFGFVWLGFVSVFGIVAWLKFQAPTLAAALWVAAVVVPVVGWLFPPFMRMVFVGMSIAAWPIGFVVSHVVLALVYYLVVTPIALVMRIVGYDPMGCRRDPDLTSYWVARRTVRGPESYFRQF